MTWLKKLSDTQLVMFFALNVSALAYLYFARDGQLLLYKDAVSHLEISRRVLDSTTRGFGQLGGVWPPLPHILSLPMIWIDDFYYSGFAGSIISMISYIIAVILIFRIIRDLTGHPLPATVGAAVFAFNPNVLYMQAAPMTELLLFACMLGAVYSLQRWIRTDNYLYLVAGGAASLLATLTRYEAWVLLVVQVAIVLAVSYRKHGWTQMEGEGITFVSVAGLGIAGWAVWNMLIFGSPTNFQTGEYAKPSLWVGEGEPSIGNISMAVKTYWYAMAHNLSVPLILVGVTGLIVLMVRFRMRSVIWPVLSMLVFVPFFVFALYKGQRPLHVEEITGDLYNVRFGLVMLLPAAIGSGYLVSLVPPKLFAAVCTAGVLLAVGLNSVWLSDTGNIATLREPLTEKSEGYYLNVQGTADYLSEHYSGGLILLESFGNEQILFDAEISFSRNVYEGSYQQWEPALEHPTTSNIEWIVMRGGDAPDKVYLTLNGSEQLEIDYELVYEDGLYQVYERRETTRG